MSQFSETITSKSIDNTTANVVKEFEFPGFNVRDLEYCNVLVIGKSDKTALLTDLVSQFPERKVVRIVNEQELSLFRKDQKAKSLRKEAENISLVLNDCMSYDQLLRCEAFKELLLNGRHFRVNTFVAVQYSGQFSQQLRAQFDYIFSLKDKCLSNQISLYNYYFSGTFKTYEEFARVFSDATSESYNSLVLDNRQIKNWWYYGAPTPQHCEDSDTSIVDYLKLSLPVGKQIVLLPQKLVTNEINNTDIMIDFNVPVIADTPGTQLQTFAGFDPEQQYNVLILGKSKSGKTTLLNHLASLFPDRNVNRVQSMFGLEVDATIQQDKFEDGCAENQVFILDEIASSSGLSMTAENILKTAKKHKISLLLSVNLYSGSYKKLSEYDKKFFDYVFVLREDSTSYIEKLYNHYFKDVCSADCEEFKDLFLNVTSTPYSTIIADRHNKICMKYTAPAPPTPPPTPPPAPEEETIPENKTPTPSPTSLPTPEKETTPQEKTPTSKDEILRRIIDAVNLLDTTVDVDKICEDVRKIHAIYNMTETYLQTIQIAATEVLTKANGVAQLGNNPHKL